MRALTLAVFAITMTNGGASLAQNRSEDTEPAAVAPPPSSDLPWFIPGANAGFAPPSSSDVHAGFSLALAVEPTFFVGSNQSVGPGAAVMLRYASELFGVDLGYANAPMPWGYVPTVAAGATPPPATIVQDTPSLDNLLLGLSFNHTGAELFHAGRHHIYVMFPEVDIRMLFNPSTPSTSTAAIVTDAVNKARVGTFAFALGGSLTAVRYAFCLGSVSLQAEVRGPIAFANVPIPPNVTPTSATGTPGHYPEPYATLGFALSLGVGF